MHYLTVYIHLCGNGIFSRKDVLNISKKELCVLLRPVWSKRYPPVSQNDKLGKLAISPGAAMTDSAAPSSGCRNQKYK